jgi:hypothetical protein
MLFTLERSRANRTLISVSMLSSPTTRIASAAETLGA